MLSPVEDFWLRWHAEHGQVELAERARLVLEAEAGASPGQVAASLGLSAQTVEGVLAKFEHDRLATFPRPSLRLEQMIQLYPAATASRRHIARLARRLFNDTRPLHHLQRKARQLLEAAALLPPLARPDGAGSNSHPEMDLLDGAILADFGAGEQAKITCVRRLQRKGYRADRDPVFRRLRPTEQSQVRYLAALLQVAQPLDHSGTQSTTLLQADLQADSVVLRLAGTNAESDGNYACRQSWLWQPVFHLALEHGIGPRPKSVAETRPAAAKADRDQPVGVVFSQQMAAALRKWQAFPPGAANTDLSGLSDLLAGVGEARAVLGAFASVLKRPKVKQVRRPLRNMNQLLTAVIEQQNALSDLETYSNGRSPATVAELQPLREAWERASRRKLIALRAWLEGEEAASLYAALAVMAQAAPVRRSKSCNIRVAAPVLLDQLCAEAAEREEDVIADRPGTYRRYWQGLASLACALQALGGKASLGEVADPLLADVQRLQGRIDRWLASSALNDALAEFLDSWAEQQARRKAPQLYGAQSVLAYRQARRSQWSRLRSSLPADWRPVRANRLRRRVNSLLQQLERHS
jgi:hypothetical protein